MLLAMIAGFAANITAITNTNVTVLPVRMLPIDVLIVGMLLTISALMMMAIIRKARLRATRLHQIYQGYSLWGSSCQSAGQRAVSNNSNARMRSLASLLAVLLLSAFSFSTFSFGRAGGLYDDIVEDIAFVRFVHAAPGQGSSEVRIMAVPFLDLEPQQVSPYQSLAPGSIRIEIADSSSELELNSGDFYTVVLHDEGLLILEDSALDDPTRALLSLYNLSDIAALSLSSADGSAEVFRDVAPQNKASIAVNATDISLAVSGDGEVLEVLEDLRLERAEAYSIIALASDEGTVFLWVQADVVSE